MTTIIKNAAISTTPSGHIAYVHLQIPKDAIQSEMGPAISEVFAAVVAQNLGIRGPWLTIHHSITPETWDFDACVLVEKAGVPTGRVSFKQLPAARAATATYEGPYEGLRDAWPELRTWVANSGLSRDTWLLEQYMVGPESKRPEREYVTQLYVPVQQPHV